MTYADFSKDVYNDQYLGGMQRATLGKSLCLADLENVSNTLLLPLSPALCKIVHVVVNAVTAILEQKNRNC